MLSRRSAGVTRNRTILIRCSLNVIPLAGKAEDQLRCREILDAQVRTATPSPM